jgi:hypothetical protein
MDKYIYKGGGYFAGLPARDMAEDEWKSYPEELTKPALKQGLYELSKSKPTKEVKDA